MNRLRLAATKVHIRWINADFKEVAMVRTPEGTEEEVVVFSSGNPVILSQTTGVGTIIIHDLVFVSDRLLKYVLVHELSHRRQLYPYVFYPLSMLLLAESIGLVAAALTVFPIVAITNSDLQYAVAIPIALVVAPMLVVLACFLSWLFELWADYRSIKVLGIKTVAGAKEDGRKLVQMHPNYFVRLIGWLSRPPLLITYRLYLRLNRRTIDMGRL
jgi:hypothetical protein